MSQPRTTNKLVNVFEKLDKGIVFTLCLICVCCFTLLLLLLAGNVFVRYVPVAAFYWFDEVVKWMFAWMVFSIRSLVCDIVIY